MKKNEVKDKIIKLLRKQEKPLTQTQISKILKVNKATISKYVAILSAEGKVSVETYGNVNLVRIKEE